MKAYIVSHRYYDYSGVVFAENRGQAKSYVIRSEIYGDDVEYTDIRARRIPAFDKYYNGRWEMNWDNPQDRILMVKEAGFECSDDTYGDCECMTCPAKQYCGRWERENN